MSLISKDLQLSHDVLNSFLYNIQQSMPQQAASLTGELMCKLVLAHVTMDSSQRLTHTETHKHRNHLVRFTQSDLIIGMLLWYSR